MTVTAGWSWGILLLSMFITSTGLSRFSAPRKNEVLRSVVEKNAERDAWQVLANGGLFSAAALGFLMAPTTAWYALGIGALAASTADTWSTEIGTASRAEPVSIATRERVPPGTSGGITIIGSAGGIAGGLFIAALATLAHWPVAFAAVALGAIAGALTDSILGATIQERRWCPQCDRSTERLVHDCGTLTRHQAGLRGFDNDAVNAASSAVGALVSLLLN